MTVRDIQHHPARMEGTELSQSHDTISHIIDAVVPWPFNLCKGLAASTGLAAASRPDTIEDH
jgi:hypothetical protein